MGLGGHEVEVGMAGGGVAGEGLGQELRVKLLGGRPVVMTHPRVSHAIEGLTQGLLHRARLLVLVLQVPGQLLHVACSRRWLPAGRKAHQM